jgi:hypothetical protein
MRKMLRRRQNTKSLTKRGHRRWEVSASCLICQQLGYGNISFTEPASSSDYHSLQVSVNRRFARRLQFGASWTWSKAMGFNDSDAAAVSSLVSPQVCNYGLASFARTHLLKVNLQMGHSQDLVQEPDGQAGIERLDAEWHR